MKKKDYRFEKLNSIEQSLKHTGMFVFKDAIKEKKSFDWILERLKERVYDDKRFPVLPVYMRYGIRRYFDAMFDYIWTTQIEWVHWYDGKFVHKNLPYGEGFRQDLITKSSHVWEGTQIDYSCPEQYKNVTV